MTTGLASDCRCVHCLRLSDFVTADHVFPSSWYPDTTPTTVQRWTVPCCSECNQELGKLEKDLLVRLILCVDPKSSAVSGLASKALRSLGIDATGLSEREKSERQKLRDKIRSELIPRADLMTTPVEIPGLGPPQASMSAWSIPVPWAGLAIIAEKIVRGCEYKLKGRLVEAPYGMRIFIGPKESVPEPYASASQVYELGPGCNVRRIFATEDPKVVLYWICIWDTLNFNVKIDLETELTQTDQRSSRVEGIPGGQDQKAMRISTYLRKQTVLSATEQNANHDS